MPNDITPVPNVPAVQQTFFPKSTTGVKVATPDLILFDQAAVPIDVMTNLIFEDIGGQEIISISRNDIVNGQEVSYSLIGNLKELNRRYNPNNIFSLPETIEKYFSNFSIRLDTHIPDEGTGPNGQRAYIVFADTAIASRGDLIIDVTNMETNERVDVEILRNGSALSDTIYTEES